MSERRKPYPFDQIEPKWQAIWDERQLFHAPNPDEDNFDPAKAKFYILDMFPYPSGAGLHVGHPEGYTATDIVARYKRMRGFNVLHPMGWDAFGLPAEQYAIKSGQHPAVTTRENVAKFKSQLKRIGFSYDWQREINTTDPRYYKWTQWIFLQLYNSWFDDEQQRARPISELRERMRFWLGHDAWSEDVRRELIDDRRLAYVEEAYVWWCPALGTVLSNEEVVEGRSEVGGHPVERRPMRQWMLRITKYARRLVEDLERLDWPESIKTLQRNWIGRSAGAVVRFHAERNDIDFIIEVFTTRPDTLFGATFIVLAPEHPFVTDLTTEDQQPRVEAYRRSALAKSILARSDLSKEKTGVFTGSFAINPANGGRIPIWVGDYVIMKLGSEAERPLELQGSKHEQRGAVMGVPAHDERDLEFARKFQLPIVEVVQPIHGEDPVGFTGEGIAVNSSFINGLPTVQAEEKIIAWLEANGHGHGHTSNKLSDWLFSRQRYWGEPFPVVWEDGKHRVLDDSELPVVPPPLDDYKPTGTGEPPLAKAKDWVRYSDKALRETNTMPQWAGSCWYYLRFCDPQNDQRFVGEEAERYWMGGDKPGGVDLYVGGTEHAVLHLLYARFWHKVLFDLGYVSKAEPFQRLVNQGIILGEDNQKMSKSRGNIVNPDDVIDQYGADAFRCYEMFMGPLEQMKPWSMRGVEGVARFLARVWRLFMTENQAGNWELSAKIRDVGPTGAQTKITHATIKKVTNDIESLSFNTAISQMMIFVNAFTNAETLPLSAIRSFLVLLNPFAPHLTSELWEKLNAKFRDNAGEITGQKWPDYDERFLVEDEVEMVIQVNGKVRDRMKLSILTTEDEMKTAALANPKIQKFTAGKTIRKIVVVPRKLVNVVV